MILAESGFLIALAKPKDDLHSKAVAWSACVRDPLLVSEYVLLEVVNYLSLVKDRSKVHPFVDQIMTAEPFEFVAASRELLHHGLRLHRDRAIKNGPSPIAFHFI
jgi:hypothetical protein